MTLKRLLLATTVLPVLTALSSVTALGQEGPDTSIILLTQAAPVQAPAVPPSAAPGAETPAAGEGKVPRRTPAGAAGDAADDLERRKRDGAGAAATEKPGAKPGRGEAGSAPAEGATSKPATGSAAGAAPAERATTKPAGSAAGAAPAEGTTTKPGGSAAGATPAEGTTKPAGSAAGTAPAEGTTKPPAGSARPATSGTTEPATRAQDPAPGRERGGNRPAAEDAPAGQERRNQGRNAEDRQRRRDETPAAEAPATSPAPTAPSSAQPAPSPTAPSGARQATPPASTTAPSSAQPTTPPATAPSSAQPATPPAAPPASAQPATPPAAPPASAQPASPPAAQPGVAQPTETPESRRERRLREAGRPAGTDAPAAGQPGGERIQELRLQRRERAEDGGRRIVIEEPGNRTIVRENGRVIIRHDETERLRRSYRDVQVERRGDDRVIIARRPNGVEVITYQDEDGTLLRRVRRDRGGRETILIDNREGGRDRDRGRDRSRRVVIEESVDLAPVNVRIPREKYVVEVDRASRADIEEAFTAPPIERIERSYTLDEVRQSPNLRERMRRVDLDTVTFDFGSWELTPDQSRPLEEVATGLKAALEKNPDEIFLVEGHTDAVGPDVDNLTLSDRRAENVALVLSEEFGVPAENLTTQGYGEQYLKVNTQEPERENRRVTLRRITPLLQGANAAR